MADSLPKPLRDIENLNSFIKQRLPEEWGKISNEVKERYPEGKYKILERWRSREAFKVSYILSRSLAQDFLIDYISRSSFTPEFQKHIAGRIDRNQLKKILKRNRHKIREIVSKISMEFLLSDIPASVREAIIKNEDGIKDELHVKTITDYRLLEMNRLKSTLAKSLSDTEESSLQTYSAKIINESQRCHEALGKLGIELSQIENREFG